MKKFIVILFVLMATGVGAIEPHFIDAEPFVYVEKSYVFTVDGNYASHRYPAFDTAIAGADSVLSFNSEAPEFAWIVLDSLHREANWDDTTVSSNYYYRVHMKSGTGVGVLPTWNLLTSERTIELMYLDWQTHLPENVQIISAKINRHATNDGVSSLRDTLVSVLMDNTEDYHWITSRGLTGVTHVLDYMSHATWAHQVTANGTNGYPSSGAEAWVPAVSVRSDYKDWGSVADFTGWDVIVPDESIYQIDITNCVQEAVLGNVNYGIAMMQNEEASGVRWTYTTHWEPKDTFVDVQPWIEVKFLEKKYLAPMPNDAKFAFVFSTDSADLASHSAYVDSVKQYDGSITVTFNPGNLGGAGEATWDDVWDWYEDGMEIGSHGVLGNTAASSAWFGKGNSPQYSMKRWPVEFYAGMYPTTLTGAASSWDSLLYDMDPTFIHNAAYDAGYSDSLRTDLRVGKAYTFPANDYSAYMLQAANVLGLESYRGAYLYSSTASVQHLGYGLLVGTHVSLFGLPEIVPAGVVVDSLMGGFDPVFQLVPRNVNGIKSTTNAERLVGLPAANPTKADVQAIVRNLARKVKAQNTYLISLYSHGVKSLPVGNTIDADEFGWILETIYEEGGRAMGMTEYTRWLRDKGTAVATPAGHSIADSLKFTAADKIWYVPNGSNGRFIPGVKP